MNKSSLLMITLLIGSANVFAAQSDEATARYLSSIMSQPQKLQTFLNEIPKGGDLHNHASGSTFAEDMLQYGARDNLCVDRTTYTASINHDCSTADLLNNAIQDPAFKDALIDAWSMQHFVPGKETGHSHFFNTFMKFNAISGSHTGEIFAEIMERAAEQNESYIETMVTADANASGMLGKQLGYNANFSQMRANLLAHQFDKIVASISTNLDEAESKQRSILQCGTAQHKPGCHINIRYLYQILREQAPEMVFAQMLAGFESASKDKRVVGINMVMAEDGTLSMRDYDLHMQMLAYLHSVYPDVHISLHAGELTKDLVPAEGLRFHINEAVNMAHAERIGHGVDIASEDNYQDLLQQMAKQRVMVEINLSSNAKILNVSGKDHPLPLYLQYGVPVALSTDDEGVNRDIMTTEYVMAVTTFHLDYPTLKNMVRNSLAYSFLPGKSLWQDKAYQQLTNECAQDIPGTDHASSACMQFLDASEKATSQWDLERSFIEFENKFHD